MKYTTVKYSEIAKDPHLRLDAKYWINKKENNFVHVCPQCNGFTFFDEWAKPQVACIDCGFEE